MRFVQVQVGKQQVGHFRNPQTAPQHEDEHGAVAYPGVCFAFGGRGSLDGGKELRQVIFGNRPGQALRFTQVMAVGQHWADQRRIVVGEKGVQAR